MVYLKTRSGKAEVMDDLDLPSAEIDPVLAGLAKMNRWFGAHKTVIKTLQKFPDLAYNHVSDWGCGGGDMLVALRKWSDRHHLSLYLTGVDAAKSAVRYAKRHSLGCRINYIQASVLSDDLHARQFDIVTSGLFSHHFADREWVLLIRKMYTCSRRGVILTDLHRHWLLYYAVTAITRLITKNKMARVDGPLSVKRSFKRKEIVSLLKAAQIDNYNLTWVWPFRWLLIIRKH
ncbi:methyltransferase domain-containing protein [Mucilaginibacter mali]|uniref:Methyltransferase domain-containing protein n=1 Tax=Mucilaginibacter mali TaxID=2740462 RepID=A0A7D4Q319_9SPHI|nr:methyltransferase domain-containing protein [Mucilaginibacter mali]QKJ31866.1 methyltransferase domain-containing protein [Mucilaginibacter mali]